MVYEMDPVIMRQVKILCFRTACRSGKHIYSNKNNNFLWLEVARSKVQLRLVVINLFKFFSYKWF